MPITLQEMFSMQISISTFLHPESCIKTYNSRNSESTVEDQKELIELRRHDTEVRAHEAAHKAAGGQYASAASFQYQTGPDGKQYAVGGEVSIDSSPVSGKPQATIQKMQVVRRAALAPANPSGQDRRVAASAAATEAKAREQLRKENTTCCYTNNGKTDSETYGDIDLMV